ncbi:presequence protease, mitochondrial isoform X2 [Takifugu flavidus]|uniref:presequence protease, mitochondrial isoform X2 n=1 Tax=Takifugu flavidus TaxID=433684 RepID=UPI002544770D|nr:presequence protease, mitochondrial isoform X2 [Takifugu flavidus]
MFRQTTTTALQKLRRLGLNGRQHTWRLKGTSAKERALQYHPGEKIHGFTVKEVVAVPDLFLTAVKLRHDKTGAQYLHAARDDSNNLFSVQFRTTPMDSTGVPHILEHTVLCGSARYPCRDPFFKMLNRSLSTFMNAFTASDYTMYPFSTQNGKDFQNLLSVYLDAVFFPCLREQDFRQEGWRLENENPSDADTPLIFKGVVFNEMKGAFSDNERVYAQHLQNKLYPDHTYSVVSGGEPLAIPDLTWEELRQFHATHYHPSNARFFTYGDLPLEQHLKQIEEEALSRFECIDPKTEVPAQPRWSCPREDHVTCSPDPLAPDPTKQNTLCVSYLLGDITDTFEGFTLSLLSSLMISGPNSPFYKALIEPKIGTDFSSVVGYDGSTKEASFSIGLQGIAEEDTERVKHLISQTIDDIIENGFEEEQIEALLHKIELQMKHQSTNFGLSLASYIASSWNHDGDPVELLQINTSVLEFRRALKENPAFLQDKVRHYFKENTHRLTLSMKPDEAYMEKQVKAEEEKLGGKVQALTDADRKEIYEKGLELLAAQSQTQDASCLPALQVSDITPTIPITPVQMGSAAGVPVQYCEQPTNGLVYFRAMCSLNTLPEDLRLYVPLFCSVITKMGCGALDYRQQAQQMELRTGGMSVSTQVIPDSTQLDMFEQGILLSSSSLERNLPHMFQLWSDIFNSPRLEDEERLRVLVMMAAQELANGISYSGHVYAMTRAGRHLTPAGDLQEVFGGIEQVKFTKRIAEMSDLTQVIRILPRIKKHLFNPENMRCAVNATPERMGDAAAQLENFLEAVSKNRKQHKTIRSNINEELNFHPCQMKTFFQMPFPVNFTSKCIRAVPFSHQDYASLCVLARMMTAKFLHCAIREKGGAYGGGAMVGGGLFSFYSYRDPNSVQTLKVFGESVDWAKSGQFTQQDVDEAKLSVFSSVDSPVAPADKGMSRFLSGVTDQMKQQHREKLFAVNHRNLVEAAERYLGVGQQTCGVAVLGPENEDIQKDPSWIIK